MGLTATAKLPGIVQGVVVQIATPNSDKNGVNNSRKGSDTVNSLKAANKLRET